MANIEGKVAMGCPGLNLSGVEISGYYQKLREIDPIITDGAIDIAQGFVNEEKIGVKLLAMASNPNSRHYRETSAFQPLIHALNVAAFDVAKKAGKLDGVNLSFLLGQDVGQFGAAVIAGGLSREDSAHLVTLRGVLAQQANGRLHTAFMSNSATKFNAEINRLRVKDPLKNPEPISIKDPEIPMILDGFIVRESPRMMYFMVTNMVEPDKYDLCCKTLINNEVQMFLISGPGSDLSTVNKANGFAKTRTINITDLF